MSTTHDLASEAEPSCEAGGGAVSRPLRIAVVCGDRGVAATGYSGASEHLRNICSGFLGLGASVQLWCQRLFMDAETPLALLPPGLVALEAPRGRLPGALRKRVSWDHGIDARAMSRWALSQAREYLPHFIYERFALYSSPGLRVAQSLGIPYVVELNAPLSWESALFRGMPANRSLLERESKVLTQADVVLCVSQALAEYAIRRGVCSERVLVQPNGAAPLKTDGDQFPASKASATPAGETFVLGYAGSFKPWHGLLGSLSELRELREELRPRVLHLDLWGDGPERARFVAALCKEADITLSDHGFGTSREVWEARGSWDAAWVPLAPWPPLRSSSGRSLAELERAFGESVPECYFSPLKGVEALSVGLPVWPPRASSTMNGEPLSWTQVASRVLKAVGFPQAGHRRKMAPHSQARRQVSL